MFYSERDIYWQTLGPFAEAFLQSDPQAICSCYIIFTSFFPSPYLTFAAVFECASCARDLNVEQIESKLSIFERSTCMSVLIVSMAVLINFVLVEKASVQLETTSVVILSLSDMFSYCRTLLGMTFAQSTLVGNEKVFPSSLCSVL